MQSIDNKLLKCIRGHGRGYVFTAKDFLRFANRASVDKALSVLAGTGTVRRVIRGVYHYPEYNADLGGWLGPSSDRIAKAIARRSGVRIQPAGAVAANMLGLSTQVPAKAVFLTDGKSHTFRVGNRTITFKRVPPRELKAGSEIGALVVHAFRDLGRAAVDDQVIARLRKRLPAKVRKSLLNEAGYMEDWIYDAVKRLATEEEK